VLFEYGRARFFETFWQAPFDQLRHKAFYFLPLIGRKRLDFLDQFRGAHHNKSILINVIVPAADGSLKKSVSAGASVS
jgi:hypothetical protein